MSIPAIFLKVTLSLKIFSARHEFLCMDILPMEYHVLFHNKFLTAYVTIKVIVTPPLMFEDTVCAKVASILQKESAYSQTWMILGVMHV